MCWSEECWCPFPCKPLPTIHKTYVCWSGVFSWFFLCVCTHTHLQVMLFSAHVPFAKQQTDRYRQSFIYKKMVNICDGLAQIECGCESVICRSWCSAFDYLETSEQYAWTMNGHWPELARFSSLLRLHRQSSSSKHECVKILVSGGHSDSTWPSRSIPISWVSTDHACP